MRSAILAALIGSSSLLSAGAAFAQAQSNEGEAAPSAIAAQEIVVTARRREERLLDVPQTVNVVTGAAIEKLNITQFEDISKTVPGLTLQSTGSGFTFRSSLRGISFDTDASIAPNVQYYINDAFASPFSLYQSMYDVGQIEVLRGPQGTLRGRSAPSGQITLTTRRPDLYAIGGYGTMSGSTQGEISANGALSIPIVSGVAALRVAGLVNENDGNQVRPVGDGQRGYSRSTSGRVSLRVEPSDAIDMNIMYQYLSHDARTFTQSESTSLSQPNAAAGYGSTTLIRARDRWSASDNWTGVNEEQHLVTGNLNVRFGGQQLSYVGSYFHVNSKTVQNQDTGGVFTGHDVLQIVPIKSDQQSHEVRLSSDGPLFGFIDYTVGGFYVKSTGSNDISSPTVIAYNGGLPPGIPGFPLYIAGVSTPLVQGAPQTEKSLFGNVTVHIGEKTEVSAGGRYIDFKTNTFLTIAGAATPLQTTDKHYTTGIYNFSIKHRFQDDLMVYATTGTSWRPGTTLVGVFRPLDVDPVLPDQFVNVRPEKSTSYEIGLKGSFFDRKLDLSLDAYHQTFDGYLYRAPLANYIDLDFSTGVPVEKLGQVQFLANVPAKVDGIEAQATFRPNSHFYLDAQFSYARSRIKNGVIPCNDLNGDGQPDAGVPTIDQILAVSGGQAVAQCITDARVTNAPNWSVVLQSEYNVPLTSRADGFVRGLLSYYPKNSNEPGNPYDTVKDYGLLNLYLGLRDPNGAWELSIFAKNLTNTFRVLTRGQLPQSISALDAGLGLASVNFRSNYVPVTVTPPREFGLSLRYAFGAR